mgnify:CR=1 FL=1
MQMKVLITGGNGFIGRYVAAEVRRRGHNAVVLARNPAPGEEAAFVCQDLRQPDGLAAAIKGMDAVVHCAAAMDGDLHTQIAATVEGTANLLAAMTQAGVRHIVGVSTFALYDYLRIPPESLLDEDSPLESNFPSRAPYIQAKARQEDLIREHTSANQWRWTIVRPGIVFGRDRTWFHHLGMQLTPRQWVCLAGDSLLPLTYVENCADCIVDALENDAANGATFNIVDDDLPGRFRYMDALAKRAQPKPSIIGVPWSFLDRASRLASGLGDFPLPDLLRPASLHARCKPLRYSNRRAKQALGWRPRWSIEEGINRSFATPSGPAGRQ